MEYKHKYIPTMTMTIIELTERGYGHRRQG